MLARLKHDFAALAAAALLAAATPAIAADKVTIAYIGGTADVGFYIADAKGFLKEEGIEANFIVFDSSAKMVAPLATGEVDVGSGAVSAALYNAFERGITMRVVADKSGNKGALSYQSFVTRKTLWDSGAVRSLKDLKGRKFAATAQGNNEAAMLDEAMRSVGLTSDDVDKVYLSMPQQVAAYANGAIDASFIAEPFLSAAIKTGSIVDIMPITRIRDPSVTGIIIYSDKLIRERPAVARAMAKAYVRGLRVYNDALKDNRLAGPGADEVVDIIARYSVVKDKELLRNTIPHFVDPDGRIPDESLRKDWRFYKAQGLVKGDIGVDDIMDKRWIEEAVRELGPYKPKS